MLYDKDIREPLFEFFELQYGKSRIIEEKRIGKARADVILVLPGKIAGVEIKSDADTYTRLAGQVREYDRYFDLNYIVAGSTHAAFVASHVPDYWGIVTVEEINGKVDFLLLREASANPKMKWKKKITLLWRPELAHLQEINGLPRYKQKSKAFVQGKILEKIPPDILTQQISEELFERDYTSIAEEIENYKREHG